MSTERACAAVAEWLAARIGEAEHWPSVLTADLEDHAREYFIELAPVILQDSQRFIVGSKSLGDVLENELKDEVVGRAIRALVRYVVFDRKGRGFVGLLGEKGSRQIFPK